MTIPDLHRNSALIQAVAFLDSWLAYRLRQVDLPGLSVVVSLRGQPLFQQAYGWANLERRRPLTSRHRFHLASQTKMLTATAVLQLVQAGHLALDDPAVRYLPWLRPHSDRRYRHITLRQLLTHSAGLLRDGLDCDYWQQSEPCPSVRQLRQLVLATPLAAAPGTEVKYSNLGFALLGQIIESVSGQPYATQITKAILTPLGLTDTALDYDPRRRLRLATGYGLPVNHRRTALTMRWPTDSLAPATGFQASPEVIAHFAAALCRGRTELLSDKLKREMQRTQQKVTRGYDQGTEFGLGLEVHHIGSRRLVGHSGHIAGHVTATYFDPLEHLVVAVATNSRDAPAPNIARGIWGALDFFLQSPLPSTSPSGRFSVRLCNDISTIEIVDHGGRIIAIDPDDWEPFGWSETLELAGDTTLRFTTPGSIYNHNEKLEYNFAGSAVQQARLAGFTMRPDPLAADLPPAN